MCEFSIIDSLKDTFTITKGSGEPHHTYPPPQGDHTPDLPSTPGGPCTRPTLHPMQGTMYQTYPPPQGDHTPDLPSTPGGPHTRPTLHPRGTTHQTYPPPQGDHTPDLPSTPGGPHTRPTLHPRGITHQTYPPPQGDHTPDLSTHHLGVLVAMAEPTCTERGLVMVSHSQTLEMPFARRCAVKMADIWQSLNRVQYVCSCGRLSSLVNQYFCRHCSELKCQECVFTLVSRTTLCMYSHACRLPSVPESRPVG